MMLPPSNNTPGSAQRNDSHLAPGITTVFLDLFGVLLGSDQSAAIHYAARELGLPYAACQNAFSGEFYMQYLRKELSFNTFLAGCLKTLPGNDKLDRPTLRHLWLDRPLAELPLAGILPKLGRTHAVWILSNTTDSHMNFLRQRFDFLRYPKGTITSESAGRPKPDPLIFNVALRQAGAAAAEAIFIDDTAQHVSAARRLGFTTHLFRDYATTIEFLNLALGLTL